MSWHPTVTQKRQGARKAVLGQLLFQPAPVRCALVRSHPTVTQKRQGARKAVVSLLPLSQAASLALLAGHQGLAPVLNDRHSKRISLLRLPRVLVPR